MKVVEYQDGGRRCVVWELPDSGWEDVAGQLDRFLSHALEAIAAEYEGEPVEWLEINHWPISGRLMVFPSREGPSGDRTERLYFELSSEHLENESRRIGDALAGEEQERASEELTRKVWRRVSECLCRGEASGALASARRAHPFRVAAFDYAWGEGPPRLQESGALA